MALVAQVRGIDSTLGHTKTVVGALSTVATPSNGDLIQGWNGSSYVYYNGTAALDGAFSVFVDFTPFNNFNNYTLVAQGGAGQGRGFRLRYHGDQYAFTVAIS